MTPCEILLPGETQWQTALAFVGAAGVTSVRVWDGSNFVGVHTSHEPFDLRWMGSRVTQGHFVR